jgi:uncharacterized GH25 family protein
MSSLRPFVLAALLGCVAQTALAHSPYLLPNQFDVTERDHVSVQASFTEEFFNPDVVMKAEGYHALLPDGRRVALVPNYTKDLAVLDVDTTVTGTYRLSTGVRGGRTSKAALVNGAWKFFDEDEAPPAGAKLHDMRSVTRADVYVSRGTPTDAVVAPGGKGLEFQMLTHPNRLFAGKPAQLRVLFDGKPLVGQLLQLQRAASVGEAAPAAVELRSGADGAVTLPLSAPGLYHAMTRYRFALPSGEAKAESHTYALTLEVTE